MRLCLPQRLHHPSPEQVQRDTSAADTDNDTIWIGCEKSTRKNSMVRTCISALTWETLAYLALNKKIVLDLTPCGECENDLCAAQLRKELTSLWISLASPCSRHGSLWPTSRTKRSTT